MSDRDRQALHIFITFYGIDGVLAAIQGWLCSMGDKAGIDNPEAWYTASYAVEKVRIKLESDLRNSQ